MLFASEQVEAGKIDADGLSVLHYRRVNNGQNSSCSTHQKQGTLIQVKLGSEAGNFYSNQTWIRNRELLFKINLDQKQGTPILLAPLKLYVRWCF